MAGGAIALIEKIALRKQRPLHIIVETATLSGLRNFCETEHAEP